MSDVFDDLERTANTEDSARTAEVFRAHFKDVPLPNRETCACETCVERRKVREEFRRNGWEWNEE